MSQIEQNIIEHLNEKNKFLEAELAKEREAYQKLLAIHQRNVEIHDRLRKSIDLAILQAFNAVNTVSSDR